MPVDFPPESLANDPILRDLSRPAQNSQHCCEFRRSHNLAIMSRCKRDEEREFYLRMASRERWSFRDLQRQLNGALFERVVLSPAKLSTPLTVLHPDAAAVFKDSYLVEFLDLSKDHSEADLHRGLWSNASRISSSNSAAISASSAAIIPCRSAPKTSTSTSSSSTAASPASSPSNSKSRVPARTHGQTQFYLEALDRDVKKPHEQPSIGVLLCATKNQEVVEYALSRAISPALVAEYQTACPTSNCCRPNSMSSTNRPMNRPRGHPQSPPLPRWNHARNAADDPGNDPRQIAPPAAPRYESHQIT